MLTRPEDFDVIATLNLNGDYLSDALAAQVGGIGIAPGGNINYVTGHAIFEATHGTAPKYANQDKVNPGSVILSGEMMFRYLGWTEAADLIIKGMDGAIGAKTVTYDFARQMDGAKEVKCSEFAQPLGTKGKKTVARSDVDGLGLPFLSITTLSIPFPLGGNGVPVFLSPVPLRASPSVLSVIFLSAAPLILTAPLLLASRLAPIRLGGLIIICVGNTFLLAVEW